MAGAEIAREGCEYETLAPENHDETTKIMGTGSTPQSQEILAPSPQDLLDLMSTDHELWRMFDRLTDAAKATAMKTQGHTDGHVYDEELQAIFAVLLSLRSQVMSVQKVCLYFDNLGKGRTDEDDRSLSKWLCPSLVMIDEARTSIIMRCRRYVDARPALEFGLRGEDGALGDICCHGLPEHAHGYDFSHIEYPKMLARARAKREGSEDAHGSKEGKSSGFILNAVAPFSAEALFAAYCSGRSRCAVRKGFAVHLVAPALLLQFWQAHSRENSARQSRIRQQNAYDAVGEGYADTAEEADDGPAAFIQAQAEASIGSAKGGGSDGAASLFEKSSAAEGKEQNMLSTGETSRAIAMALQKNISELAQLKQAVDDMKEAGAAPQPDLLGLTKTIEEARQDLEALPQACRKLAAELLPGRDAKEVPDDVFLECVDSVVPELIAAKSKATLSKVRYAVEQLKQASEKLRNGAAPSGMVSSST
ncbi:unnamed protein product [Amoebophrya sp. A25]|nr:unnamed protein product [Amoebophrya sp. A25]|eukprot:GSA25T00006652001.1